MSKHKLNVLSKELRQAGAELTEIGSLVSLAERLQAVSTPAPSLATPLLSKRNLLPPLFSSLIGLALGAWIIIAAQTVTPGSWLYPAKRLSEQAAIVVDPNYRATVMMHRAQEVQNLVAAHADTQTILATLAAYQSDAAAYRSTGTNYSAFEYCKSSLSQAEAQASPAERQAIQSTLAGLSDV